MGSKYTEAQNKATQRYLKKAYDDIRVRVPKGKKEEIREHAEKRGESVNGFINRAIDETMKKDSADLSLD